MGLPPSLGCWLWRHPAVAASIKWNFEYVPGNSTYDVPESAKKAWSAFRLP
jgi:hypothetical protein